tara:strand:- start:2142 stop:2957 length:816 start_codon:yes stop_codon:yes gene_type:complete
MKIIIDSREPNALQNLIKEKINKNIELEIIIKNLDLGDIQIFRNNSDIIPSLIIERKCLNDLISSVKDGRYNEQSFRLNHSELHNHNIFYLIEGTIDYIKNEKSRQIIYSSMLSLSYFKGFSLINTNNITQSANIIVKFIEKLNKEPNKISFYNNNNNNNNNENNNQTNNESNNENNNESNNIEKNYTQVIKSSKKSNITKDNILEIMLMQIPGVSSIVAAKISNNFKSLKNLLENLENNPDCLNNLKYDGEINRKFSKTTLINIKEYLLL